MATSSILDSEATFVQQAEDAGLTQLWVDALKAGSLATFAKQAFAVTSPGTVAMDEQVNRFLNALRPGAPATIAKLSAFKRILFESQTLMMHSFKATAKGDDSAPKRMAQPEWDARLERQREQLRELEIKGPLEPAHGLYDLCAAMIERDEVSYINPNRCLSRQQELMGSKPEKEIQLDATRTSLVVKEQQSHSEINISTDLTLYQALQRRTLAMDLTGLASYQVMRKWIDRLLSLYAQAPAPGFQKVTQAQLCAQTVKHLCAKVNNLQFVRPRSSAMRCPISTPTDACHVSRSSWARNRKRRFNLMLQRLRLWAVSSGKDI